MIIKEVKRLREKVTEHWSFENPKKDTKEFVKELVDAMWSHSGLGISANQIGHNYRVFAMRGDTKKDSICLLYTSPSPRDRTRSRMPSSA